MVFPSPSLSATSIDSSLHLPVRRLRGFAPARPSPHAAPRLRLRPGRSGGGYKAHSRLSRPPEYPAHRALHRRQSGPVREVMAVGKKKRKHEKKKDIEKDRTNSRRSFCSLSKKFFIFINLIDKVVLQFVCLYIYPLNLGRATI